MSAITLPHELLPSILPPSAPEPATSRSPRSRFILHQIGQKTTDAQPTALRRILAEGQLHALFQPIIDIRRREFLGFEGLIRGPSDSPLHAPANLFGAAQREGLSLEVEMLARQTVLRAFAKLNLPGSLFLNVSPQTLTDPGFRGGQTLQFLRDLNLDPARVVIEITENQPTFDFEHMRNALLHYRAMGFQIAIDDLGEGFSSLRLWSELRPEFVKIDMHFVQGVDRDPVKLQFLKSVQGIAESCGTRIIAEGIETESELKIIRDLGIAMGQGYFIARPQPTPPASPAPDTQRILNAATIALFPENPSGYRGQVTAGDLLTYIEPVHPEETIGSVMARFNDQPGLRALPVVASGLPQGLIERHGFIGRFARPFQLELHGRKPCIEVLYGEPLLVEKHMPLQELSHFMAEAEARHLAEGFIVTEQGRYIGVASGQDLLRELTRMQLEAARYANPLTLLPGNVPINQHIERLLDGGHPFVACYCDLDHFKPYNDTYGYRKGDELIQLTGRLLNWACDPKLDFIGHIGGDDFVLLMQSRDWRSRCENALRSFEQAAAIIFSEADLAAGGFNCEGRDGATRFHPLTTLSIGAVPVSPGQYASHHAVSAAMAEAKKMAKRTPGNALFLEQRTPPKKFPKESP